MATVTVNRSPLLYPNKYYSMHLSVNAKFNGFSQKGSVCTLHYTDSLSESEVSTIITADANYIDNDPYEYILTEILIPARQFGDRLIDEFAAENVLLGISYSPSMTNHVRKTMREVSDALGTGSLKDAMYEARQISSESKDATFITDARLLKFINRIETYLGMELSTTL